MLLHPDGRACGSRAVIRYTRIAVYKRVQDLNRERGSCGAQAHYPDCDASAPVIRW